MAAELRDPSPEYANPVEEARKRIERDGRLPQNLKNLALAYIQTGKKDTAHKLLDERIEMYETSRVGNIAFHIASFWRTLEDHERMITWLQRSYERRDPMLINLKTGLPDHQFRRDPRFQAILKKMRLD